MSSSDALNRNVKLGIGRADANGGIPSASPKTYTVDKLNVEMEDQFDRSPTGVIEDGRTPSRTIMSNRRGALNFGTPLFGGLSPTAGPARPDKLMDVLLQSALFSDRNPVFISSTGLSSSGNDISGAANDFLNVEEGDVLRFDNITGVGTAILEVASKNADSSTITLTSAAPVIGGGDDVLIVGMPYNSGGTCHQLYGVEYQSDADTNNYRVALGLIVSQLSIPLEAQQINMSFSLVGTSVSQAQPSVDQGQTVDAWVARTTDEMAGFKMAKGATDVRNPGGPSNTGIQFESMTLSIDNSTSQKKECDDLNLTGYMAGDAMVSVQGTAYYKGNNDIHQMASIDQPKDVFSVMTFDNGDKLFIRLYNGKFDAPSSSVSGPNGYRTTNFTIKFEGKSGLLHNLNFFYVPASTVA